VAQFEIHRASEASDIASYASDGSGNQRARLEFGRISGIIWNACGRSNGVKEELWIGLVNVKPLPRAPKALGGAAGAWVNMVTWASDPEMYKAKAETVAATYDVYVVEIEDSEPVAIRKSRFMVDDEIEDIISRVELNRDFILFGTFHYYPHETA
jgi:hypothetical protein